MGKTHGFLRGNIFSILFILNFLGDQWAASRRVGESYANEGHACVMRWRCRIGRCKLIILIDTYYVRQSLELEPTIRLVKYNVWMNYTVFIQICSRRNFCHAVALAHVVVEWSVWLVSERVPRSHYIHVFLEVLYTLLILLITTYHVWRHVIQSWNTKF